MRFEQAELVAPGRFSHGLSHHLPTPAEYCPRGSLFDLLQAAQRSPAAARQLTWGRRLHLVSLLRAAGLGAGLRLLWHVAIIARPSAANVVTAATSHFTPCRTFRQAVGAAKGVLHLHTRQPQIIHRDLVRSPACWHSL